ncbi:hypothetical protein E3E28_01225 [Thermococcus sp. 21S9]|nr:hypothetical protein [Thermococcus sp. 21S9]
MKRNALRQVIVKLHLHRGVRGGNYKAKPSSPSVHAFTLRGFSALLLNLWFRKGINKGIPNGDRWEHGTGRGDNEKDFRALLPRKARAGGRCKKAHRERNKGSKCQRA